MLDKGKLYNIAIVGAGGVGSSITIPLTKWIIPFSIENEVMFGIQIFDGDKVETKNLERQSFLPDEVGMYKADIQSIVIGDVCRSFGCNSVSGSASHRYVTKDNDGELDNCLITIVGIDDVKTRYILEQDFIKHNQRPDALIVFGGNEYYDGDVNAIVKRSGKIITPLYSDRHPEIAKAKKSRSEMSCQELAATSGPQLGFVNAKVGQVMLEAVFTFLTFGYVPFYERIFDIRTGNERKVFEEAKQKEIYETIRKKSEG